MIRNIFKLTMALALILTAATSCSDDDEDIKLMDYTIKVNLPEDLKNVDPSGINLVLKNVNTGTSQTLSTNSQGLATFSGLPGVYNVTVSGTKTYSFTNSNGDDISRKVNLTGYKENMALSANSSEQAIDAIIQTDGSGWVIKEIYFTGAALPSGGAYNRDQFVEIYNNTDTVMYADGISIAQTANNTQSGEVNIYASDIDENTYVNTVYTIPGTGKDVKVEPGKSILIAPQPINHKEANENSFDLSMADYQWYDQSTMTIDVPEVPNLDRHYSYSATIWVLHNRGYVSFVIFRAPGDMAKYVEDNTDIRLNSAGRNTTAIKVPNDYILDAVELGSKSDFKTKALSSSVDVGYTYCDGANIAKSVRRKVESVEDDGRVVYKDTNNSALDFIPNATPQPKQFNVD